MYITAVSAHPKLGFGENSEESKKANIIKIETINENRSELENIEYIYQTITDSFQIIFNSTIN